MTKSDKTVYMVSVIMPIYKKDEQYAHDAIQSVINQSFVNFELIILNLENSDNILSIVQPFNDRRISVSDYFGTGSLSDVEKMSSGKYVALMFADHVMHTDRLKIQYALLEAEPTVTVCGSWIKQTVNDLLPDNGINRYRGWIENPLLSFLQKKCTLFPTAMIRKDFLKKYNLQIKNYSCIDDYRLWTETAKHTGQIYIDSQFLLYSHKPDMQPEKLSDDEQVALDGLTSETVDHLVKLNKTDHPELETILDAFNQLLYKKMLNINDVAVFFYSFFTKNKNKLLSI